MTEHIDDRALRAAILATEDQRPEADSALAPLRQGLKGTPATQALAVRAMGRLERPSLVSEIAVVLESPVPAVRAAAVNALGQAVINDTAGAVSGLLVERARTETEPMVLAVLARTLGRLPYRRTAEVREAERAIAEVAERAADAGDREAMLLGVAQGLEALARRSRELGSLSEASRARLRELARYGRASTTDGTNAPRVRRLAVQALATARDSSMSLLGDALHDPDEQVRRIAVTWLGVADAMPGRGAALQRALRDASPMVRYEALRRLGAPGGCTPAVAALDDPSPHVALLAIDLLGRCTAPESVERLTSFLSAFFDASRRSESTPAWHRPAHALVSLARIAPDRARDWLVRAAGSDIWQVRMYAARAAGLMHDRATLDTLALDTDDNVRHAAIEALDSVAGHDADTLYLAALKRDDYQLLRRAALALAGTPRTDEAAERLLQAFVRVSAERRETSRDTRMALLETLEETGRDAEGAAGALRPYLADFDPIVATRVATLLTAWTGRPHVATPEPLPPVPVPTPEEIGQLTRTRAVVHMARGGTFTLALRPHIAPTNVARFIRLARAGYFDGLTFHRVEPNFVVQGGSPGANEYAGDGPYTRDELGLLSHWRGTVGLSTRGRDTGDGQIFINLVDNPWLDHNYTVFAEIVEGLEVVDGVLEGDVIARVEIL